ncbi:MAG: 30S ribosomal protein S16 [Candidatus Levybacteria bacterium RIFCSPHIGHO2_02_FULL_40_18]|nr:MAG: 30S ribosomal protein S16 [Candidatus Levybacteria bacterium RIFCSPHIGHO2_01_FULL_40_58]OGH26804.1 MAG: 30S ribosomal protein S16 [Candidatus Levybacteria bacterium RIFCSPHIGHO2_02_FULL_40_18]OGH31739.1 MAG: 30S ribosomal protein S16 [Candidatus Levybacteria bacterium RIFCSPHIGHO2_12_FULL_40_31]OGH40639.1 MAG: 30S ribosomal protein S16 [Candidatus Levybacteria bacterium RIFCSPLOWO2_01_FULL_40_64]OGH48811.1 MAG: 30S ribosomal protein S16 [Candidatus Levybacteria bacterium RIFCSPLOWO2_02_
MSLIIRLSRIGRKGEARFRVVVKEKRSKLSGRAVDTLGTLVRRVENVEKTIDQEKLKYWISKGAQLSDSVKKMLE